MSGIAAAWNELRDKTHITVIRSDAEYNRMSRLLDMLVDEVGDDESHALASLMELVGNLVEQYEASQVSLPDLPPREVLRFLMTQHNLAQTDLNELGSQGWEAVGLTLKNGDLIAWPMVLLKRALR